MTPPVARRDRGGHLAAVCAVIATASCAPGAKDGAAPTEQIPWTEVGTLSLDAEGMTDVAAVELPAGHRYLALRAQSAEGDPTGGGLCYRFEPISLASGRMLAPDPTSYDLDQPCAQCTEILAAGRSGALAVLPTTDRAVGGPDTVELRVVARDCALGIRASRARMPAMPQQLMLTAASEPTAQPDSVARIEVRLAIVAGAELADELWNQVWQGAQERFTEVDIAIELTATAEISGANPIEVDPAADATLIDLEQRVVSALAPDASDRRWVPVVLAPCITVRDGLGGSRQPYGYAIRIPGQLSSGTSLVMISAGRCSDGAPPEPWPAQTGASILAHELGHHLGLFHADTPEGAAQSPDGGRLMDTHVADVPSGEAVFSAGQAAVLRAHPDVVFSP